MFRNQMAYGLVCVVLLMAASNVDGILFVPKRGDTEYHPRKSGSNPLQMMRAEYADILPRYYSFSSLHSITLPCYCTMTQERVVPMHATLVR